MVWMLDVPTQDHVLHYYSFEELETANTGCQGWAFEVSVPVSPASWASPCDHLPHTFPITDGTIPTAMPSLT